MAVKQSGFDRLQVLAEAKGLSVRKACLYHPGGWGYMLEDKEGKSVHWAHSLKQCQDWLKEKVTA